MAIKGPPLIDVEPTIPCKEASEALQYAIISIFCFGLILAPFALSKASKAKKMIALNPKLQGAGKVTAATAIAWAVLVLWVIGIFGRVATRNS